MTVFTVPCVGESVYFYSPYKTQGIRLRNVLIAGCGDVGCELAIRLRAEGHDVWGLRRHVENLPAGIMPVRCDLREKISPDLLPAQIDQVVFLPTPGSRDETAYQSVFQQGLEHLLSALETEERSVSRLVFVSSTSVYGQSAGEFVDENSVTEPEAFSGRILVEAENVARHCSIPSVVVRFAGIYGPGRNGLINRVKSGAACSEHPTHYTNRIHRDDCAGVLRHVLALRCPADTYLGVDDEPADLCEVMDWMASRLGVAKPPRRTREDAGQFTGKRCRNTELKASGYRFEYRNYRLGYNDLLARTP